MNSDKAKKGPDKAAHRSLMKALGFTDEEMKLPLIGVVSARRPSRRAFGSRAAIPLPCPPSACATASLWGTRG